MIESQNCVSKSCIQFYFRMKLSSSSHTTRGRFRKLIIIPWCRSETSQHHWPVDLAINWFIDSQSIPIQSSRFMTFEWCQLILSSWLNANLIWWKTCEFSDPCWLSVSYVKGDCLLSEHAVNVWPSREHNESELFHVVILFVLWISNFPARC